MRSNHGFRELSGATGLHFRGTAVQTGGGCPRRQYKANHDLPAGSRRNDQSQRRATTVRIVRTRRGRCSYRATRSLFQASHPATLFDATYQIESLQRQLEMARAQRCRSCIQIGATFKRSAVDPLVRRCRTTADYLLPPPKTNNRTLHNQKSVIGATFFSNSRISDVLLVRHQDA